MMPADSCTSDRTRYNNKKIHIFALKSIPMKTGGYVYILFNKPNGTLYTGVTSDLYKRICEHKQHKDPHSFTAQYGVDKLGYFEEFQTIQEAIDREKQIKAGSRRDKVMLIIGMNPFWEDLFDDFL